MSVYVDKRVYECEWIRH